MTLYQISLRRACGLVGLNRSSYYYRSRAKDQTALRMRIKDLASSRVRYGYLRIHALLRREGWRVNRKRVYRLYREQGLQLRLVKRRKRLSAVRVVRAAATEPNERWSMDFIHDQLADGRRFRCLTLVANFSRVSPAIEVGRSLTGRHVVAVLERLKLERGVPTYISVDNGTEFTSHALEDWAQRNRVQLDFSRPGTPTDNPFIESFNGKLRAECLDQHHFASLEEAKALIEAWRIDYNTYRPHRALGGQTPSEYEEGFNHRRVPIKLAG
jgi:putative transposase